MKFLEKEKERGEVKVFSNVLFLFFFGENCAILLPAQYVILRVGRKCLSEVLCW